MWHPEMCPIANAIVSNVRPKASATPSQPMPTLGYPVASTALPQPPSTSQNVPINSAANRFPSDMVCSRGSGVEMAVPRGHVPRIVRRAHWQTIASCERARSAGPRAFTAARVQPRFPRPSGAPMKTTLSILSTLALAGFASAQQSQVKLPAPSPAASVSRTIGNTQITIEYSSPSVKGRTIWGELVPDGQLWRMGANHCTTIQLSDSAKIGGKSIDAGTYSLFAIPTKEAWTLIINKKADLAGTDGYSEKEDLVRFQVKPEESP